MMQVREPKRRRRARLLGFVAVALLCTAAAPKPDPAKDAPLPPAEPLPARSFNEPVFLVRELSALQDRVAAGDVRSFSAQPRVVAEIARHFSALDPKTWDDARNRMALVKYVLAGGDPTTLREAAEARKFKAEETNLAHGALAYAEGHRKAAADLLGKVEIQALGPTLGGHVALIRAVLASFTSSDDTRRFCDEARVMAPGTLVEEAAMRVAIEHSINSGDQAHVRREAMRYLRRFPRSLYSASMYPRLSAHIAQMDALAKEDGQRWFDSATSYIDLDGAFSLSREIAEDALRFGKLSTAIGAAKHSRASASRRGAKNPPPWADVLEGAALVVAQDPSPGLAMIDGASDIAALPPAHVDLLRAARIVAESITAVVPELETKEDQFIGPPLPPELARKRAQLELASEKGAVVVPKGKPSGQAEGGKAKKALDEYEKLAEPTVTKVAAALEKYDKLLKETAR